MKPIRHKSMSTGLVVVLLLLLLTGGCVSTKIQIIPVPNQNVLDLYPDELIKVMRQAGFTNVQIMEYGPAVHEGLARSGRVEVKIGDKTEAAFAIRDNEVYISSRARGYFIYNVDTGWAGVEQMQRR